MNRKKIIEFLNSNETYNKVLNIVNHECDIHGDRVGDYPLDCFIAGGSITNTIHHLINKGRPTYKNKKPVINDIDIFSFNRRTDLDWGSMLLQDENFINTTINHTINMDGYGRIWVGSMGESIKMVSSERFGVINKITIDIHLTSIHEFNVTDYYSQLLNNFDLNCCSAGLDRVNGKIIYTEKFVDFLVDNKIEVTLISQPLQTAVRMLKKSKELQTNTTNFETEMSLLQHSFILKKSNFIGDEWWEKAKNYNQFLGKYFLYKIGNTWVNPIHVDNDYGGDGLYEYTSQNMGLVQYFDQFKFIFKPSLIGFWDIFVRKKSSEKLNKLITFYVQNTNFNVGPNEGIKWSFYERNRRKIKTPNPNGEYSQFMDFDFIRILGLAPNYFDCDFEVSDLVTVYQFNKFIYGEFIDPAMCLTNNIKSHIKFINFFMKKFIDEHGNTKRNLLNRITYKVTQKTRLEISTFDCDNKIEAFKKVANNIWFNMSDSGKFKHNFKYKNKSIFDINLNGEMLDF